MILVNVDTPKRQILHVALPLVRTTFKFVNIYKRQDVDKLTSGSTHPPSPSDDLKLTDPMKQTISQASPVKRLKHGPEDSFA